MVLLSELGGTYLSFISISIINPVVEREGGRTIYYYNQLKLILQFGKHFFS